MTGAMLIGVMVSFLPAWGGAHHLALLVTATLLLDFMAQGAHISNQSAIYRLPPQIRGRVTSVYMTSYFLGGAAGASVAAIVYANSGWPAVCLCGALLSGFAVLAWVSLDARNLDARNPDA